MLRIVKSFLTIAIVAAIAVGATGAYFSDTETIPGNSFVAGSLDLGLGPTTLPFIVTNAAPGDSNSGVVTLTNNGSLPGKLSMNWTKTIDEENDMIEPETARYPRPDGSPGLTTGDYAGNGGELDMFLQFAPFVDVNQDGTFNSGDIQLAYSGQSRLYPGYRSGALYFSGINSYLIAWANIMTLNAGDSVNIVIPWQFPTESTDANYSQNMAMTDSLGFDMGFSLDQ